MCYRAPEQSDGTVGLLVVSNNVANRTTREATACPVLTSCPHPGAVAIDGGWVDPGVLVPRSVASLTDVRFEADERDMLTVGSAVADLLLIGELTTGAYVAPAGPPGEYPRWGSVYYAEPPLGGQIKRWLVVSHDHFNRATGDVLCVRTTSNTSYAGPETPLIESGFAVAVCPDVQVKASRRFDLESRTALTQPDAGDRRRVAIGLANYLQLLRFA